MRKDQMYKVEVIYLSGTLGKTLLDALKKSSAKFFLVPESL